MDINKSKENDIKIQRIKELGNKAGQIIEEYSNRIKAEKIEVLSYFRKIKSIAEKNKTTSFF